MIIYMARYDVKEEVESGTGPSSLDDDAGIPRNFFVEEKHTNESRHILAEDHGLQQILGQSW